VRLARSRARRAVVSIFVNPTQFAPHEDFERYPRDEAGDLAKLASVGCDAVWGPACSVMYAEGFATRIVPAGAAEGLESDFRPHFFGGVATVCCKLFTQVLPDIAVFGEKDYQQLMVVTQMVRDLDLPLEIVGAPTVREPDGVAMSSRNAYLSAEERRIAPTLNRAILEVAAKVAGGGDIGQATSRAKAALSRSKLCRARPAVRYGCWLRPGSARRA
jgi:pantoate--beta-alanine ligase